MYYKSNKKKKERKKLQLSMHAIQHLPKLSCEGCASWTLSSPSCHVWGLRVISSGDRVWVRPNPCKSWC